MQIPKNETISVTYIFDDIKCYIVTRNTTDKYTLYKILNNDYQKLKTSSTPVDFDEVIKKDRGN